jgi:exodeoxyribonuclease VII small subunit
MVQKQTFEQALKRLEEITLNLEGGDTPLDESLKMYEEGMKLIEFCNSKLNEAQKKIQKLSKISNKDFDLEPFDKDVEDE